MNARPFYCPYCGEQDIRPQDEPGTFRCSVCDRTWSLELRRIAGDES